MGSLGLAEILMILLIGALALTGVAVVAGVAYMAHRQGRKNPRQGAQD